MKAGEGAATIGVITVTMARVETTSNRPYHLVIFGASGFTGQFVVEEVARTVSEGPNGTLKWAIAGRSKQKLEKVLEQAAAVLGMNMNYFYSKCIAKSIIYRRCLCVVIPQITELLGLFNVQICTVCPILWIIRMKAK